MQSNFSYTTLSSLPLNLRALKDPPQNLFYCGNKDLLESNAPKVAIIGSRAPNQYTKALASSLSSALSQKGAIIISGGALGTDIIAHTAALPNTICILPCSLDTIYPQSNKAIIKQIAAQGLLLSEYENNKTPKRYDFLHRNRLIIALSDVVIIPQADMYSGSMASANITATLKKPLFVLSHRIGESLGTQNLLLNNRAKPIYEINAFITSLQDYLPSDVRFPSISGKISKSIESNIAKNATLDSSSQGFSQSEFLAFCANNPTYEEALARFGETLLEYELLGKISRANGRIILHSFS